MSAPRHTEGATEAEREGFEQFMSHSRRNRGVKKAEQLLYRFADGTYINEHVQRHWWTWQQARASLSAITPESAPEALADAGGIAGVQKAPTDEELAAAAYKGYDDYWTENCLGDESLAWLASAKAVLALAAPAAAPSPAERAGGITCGTGGVTDEQFRASAYEHCFKASEIATVGEQLYLFDLARIKRLCAALTPPAPNQGAES